MNNRKPTRDQRNVAAWNEYVVEEKRARLDRDWRAFLRECKAAVRAQRRPDPSARTTNLKWKRSADGSWRVVKVRP